MAQSSCFQVKFDLDNYKKLFPEIPPSEEIINYNAATLDECIWTPQTMDELGKKFDLGLEAKRLKQGAYARIKDEVLWIPPSYYNFLNYGIAFQGNKPDFRLQQLKLYYEKLLARLNPYIIGTLLMKIRQSGITTVSCNDALYEMQDGLHNIGNINIQSKTGNDAKDVNWNTLIGLWNNYPDYIKKLMYSDFASGKFISEQMKFQRVKEGNNEARNLRIKYYNSTFDAQDGSTNVLLCILDEICKWVEAEFALTYGVCKKFIEVGSMRVGLFDMYSSPSPINNRSNQQVYELWKNSNPNEVDELGRTKSGIHRLVLSPLEGMLGEFDKFGDADPNRCYDLVMRMRKSADNKASELAEIRANPLSEEEMFETFDSDSEWENNTGIKDRKIYLMNTVYKNEETKEPKYIYGNVCWKNGEYDTEPYFEPNTENEFDIKKGRFCFSEFPRYSKPLKNIFIPPAICESCLGVDPIKIRGLTKDEKRASSGAGIIFKDIDSNRSDFTPRLIMDYACRPDREQFFEDMLLAALYTRSRIQSENVDMQFIDYVVDRGYVEWLLPSIGVEMARAKRENLFGDAAKGRGAGSFMLREIARINSLTTPSIREDQVYILDEIWFENVLDDMLKFDKADTKKSDRTMALIQACLGIWKMRNKKARNGDKVIASAINHILSF